MMTGLIGKHVSFTGSDGQRHYAGVGLRLEWSARDLSLRLVCSGRPGYDRPGEVCRLSMADEPAEMWR